MQNFYKNKDDKGKYYLTEEWSERGCYLEPFVNKNGRITMWDVVVRNNETGKKYLVASSKSFKELSKTLDSVRKNSYIFHDLLSTRQENPLGHMLLVQRTYQ
tara:strand:+ start:174 stop:479 length:306 start_codon:yes stop_codon:yes gene_type:complete